jgi:hypothetical protein
MSNYPYNSSMREWSLKSGDPLSLTLSADARLVPTNYWNDHTWELSLGGGEPPALALQTTFGLRAHNLRLFPRFTEGDLTRCDPASFTKPPIVRYFSTNYYQVTFSPFSDVEVTVDYWIPSSHNAAGRFAISNHSGTERTLRFDFIGLLKPHGEGTRMLPCDIDGLSVLAGKTNGLAPVVVLTGVVQPASGPYPALTLNFQLKPSETAVVHWGEAALSTPEDSVAEAREAALRNWEAEIARIELLASGQVEVHTGEPGWDAAFSFSQQIAYRLIMGPTAHLSHPSFVLAREPGNGYSMRGDGLDYNHQWSGQTPLDVWYLSSLLLPTSQDLVKGMLQNFLDTAHPDGFIDWKPGLAGQRSKLLATPLLASLVEDLDSRSPDPQFLDTAYPKLLAFFRSWFDPIHDRDNDGIPEWTHLLHSGYDEHPLYSKLYPNAQGANIATVENPSLCSFLFNEAKSLLRIAEKLGETEAVTFLRTVSNNLRTAVEISWDNTSASYSYWDRDSHFSYVGTNFGSRKGSGRIQLDAILSQPVRLLLRINTNGNPTSQVHAFINGSDPHGQHFVEHFSPDHFHWYLDIGSATGSRLYSRLEFITVDGLASEDEIQVMAVGHKFQEHTLFAPIWAGIPAYERAEIIVRENLTQAPFWRPYGVPACAAGQSDYVAGLSNRIHLPWNAMIGEGLLRYGFRQEAAELVTRLMTAIVKTLKREGVFRKYYDADTGQGLGEANTLDGLAPLGLFLKTLGVHLYSNKKVGIEGFNPFPTPITVKYRGTTILRLKEKTVIIFQDGQTSTITDPAPCIISLE